MSVNHLIQKAMFVGLCLLAACSTTRGGVASDTASMSDVDVVKSGVALPSVSDGASDLNSEASDPCDEQIVDEDHDGKVTMRDRYIREYELTQKGLPICVTYDRSRYMPRYTFEFDSAVLDARVVALLDEDVETLKRYPNLVVEVVGHADSRGSDAYNQELSLRRARAAYKYLVNKGVSVSRLRGPIGFGESRPVSPNTTSDGEDNPEGRARNRRIELIVQE